MEKISFTELDGLSLKLGAVKSLMTALEYGIFDSGEDTEDFRD